MYFPVQNRQYHSSCPVCKNSDLRQKYIINNFTLVKCHSCELMFVKERCSQQELDLYYKPVEDADAGSDHVYLNQANDENLKYYYRNLRSFISEKIPTGKVLDIGCNAGQFFDEMGGYECYGIERSPSYGKIAKDKYGENIFIGTFEDYPAPNFLFDCVTLQDVLDHTVDPLEVLKKCNKLLKPNGILIVKVHDMSSWFAKIMGKNFYALIPPTHLFYFSRKALATALKKASFVVIGRKHMSHRMLFSTIFYRLSRGNKDGIFFKIYKLLDGTWLGNRIIYKNLHDIMTVFAVKNEKAS